MNEVKIVYNYDERKIIKVNDIDYVPKDLLDEVIHDRRELAMDYARLLKDLADIQKQMRVAKNDINDRDRVRFTEEKLEPLDEVIYVNWSMTQRKKEKRDINLRIFERLCKENKITRNGKNIVDPSYDLVLDVTYLSYATEYLVKRNRNKLTADEIALIVSWGDLAFGYTGDEHHGKVWLG